MTRRLEGLGPVVDRYDVFLFDMWGCLHDGLTAFAGVPDLLARLRALGKKTIALSNAPRRVSILRAQLPGFGLADADFHGIVTSGEAAWQALARRAHGNRTRYYHVGMPGNLTDPAEIGLREVATLDAAEFVFATGAAGDGTLDMPALMPVLREARARDLPMVCANPDLEVLRGERRLLCAGTLAAAYEAMGGVVHYHGKPHAGVYAWALELAGSPDKARVLGVGDAMRTDVAGARAAGIDQAFIPGGIHGEALGAPMGTLPDDAKMAALSAEFGFAPTYVLAELRW
ncbi:MAG: TIGR01459 family HAD-type hydrolase [Tagaea sp.]|nr:TIGR01459 family HAD-type hydrolase [Tagaea sp.]